MFLKNFSDARVTFHHHLKICLARLHFWHCRKMQFISISDHYALGHTCFSTDIFLPSSIIKLQNYALYFLYTFIMNLARFRSQIIFCVVVKTEGQLTTGYLTYIPTDINFYSYWAIQAFSVLFTFNHILCCFCIPIIQFLDNVQR